MEIMAVLALIEKGITIANILIAAGQSAAPALDSIINLVRGTREGAVTQQDLDKTEALLDTLIADFNTELPAA